MEPESSLSPYAPPRAAVLDVEPEVSLERPPQVARAVMLLWIGFGIGIAVALYRLAVPAPQHLPLMVQSGIYAAVFLFTFWLNTKLARGRNWARLLYLICTGLGLLSAPVFLFNLFTGRLPALDSLVSLFQLGLGGYICYLLLTRPAREWFHAMKMRA
ncbi:MAG TPA: hypothetical protein VGN52_18510 [Burkholderiales bacterium]|jgi:hypothetical protein